MDNMNYEEENGVSLMDIFGWIKKGVIPGLVAGAAVLVVLLIGILLINPGKEYYEVEFDYSSLPGIGDDTGYYVDGVTKFSYNEITSSNAVKNVVAKNKEELKNGEAIYDYSKINIDKLLDSEFFKVDIKRIYFEEAGTEKEPELKATHYVLTMPSRVFPNSTMAKEFAMNLVEQPYLKTLSMISNFDYYVNLNAYNKSNTFDGRLDYLKKQVEMLLNGYENFKGYSYTVDGVTYSFEDKIAEINSFLDKNNFETMKMELDQFGYVKEKEQVQKRYEIQMEDLVKKGEYLNKQLNAVNATLEEAKNTVNDVVSGDKILSSEQIMALLTQLNDTFINEITTLKKQIVENEEEQRKLKIKIDGASKLTDQEIKAYANRMEMVKNELDAATADYDKISKAIASDNANVYYAGSNVVSLNGGFSTLIKLGLPIGAGLVMFIAVAWIVGYAKSKKEENLTEEVKTQE